VAVQFALFALIAVAPRMRHSDWSPAVRVVGIALALGGLLLCVWAIRALGPAMTAMPEPRDRVPVATRGPYRAIRHPVYAGVLAHLPDDAEGRLANDHALDVRPLLVTLQD